MKKSRNQILREVERQTTDDAFYLLMRGDLEGSDRAFKRLELTQALLDSLRRRSWLPYILPVVVALVCGTVASILAVYRIPKTTVSARIRSNSVSFAGRESFEWKGDAQIKSDSFRFEKFHSASAPPEPDEPPAADTGRGAVRLGRKGKAALKTLSIQPGTKVAVEVDRSGQIQLISSQGPVEAQLVFWGAVDVEMETNGQLVTEHMNIEVPETLYLTRTDPGMVSSVLAFDPRGSVELPIIEAADVSFSKEVLEDGVTSFVSTIADGEVTVVDTDETTSVRANQSLIMTGFEGQIRHLTVDDDVELTLTGTAESIVVSTGNIERNLVPTYLRFMYQNQQIALVWSGIAFLWGMLWSVGRFVTRRS